jgi:hypothetical protein
MNVGSSQQRRGRFQHVLGTCMLHVHACCTITKPDAARDHFPRTLRLRISTAALQGRLTRRVCEQARAAVRKLQRSEQRRQMPRVCDLALSLSISLTADGLRTGSPRFLAGGTRMKIRSRTASIFLEGVAMMKWLLCENIGLAGCWAGWRREEKRGHPSN